LAGHVLLCVTGGIAAYKACEVLRGLQVAGAEVRVAMTKAAARFVGPVTFEALTGHAVALDLFDHPESAIPHIELSEWADIALVCPCTANVMAKVAHGIADDCVSATLLACACPVLVAPAMNTRMWDNPATQENLATLERHGVRLVLPVEGRLACGTSGAGKLAPVDAIVEDALSLLRGTILGRPLAGRHVVITAGPTHEAIDPVRYIANASSGKMGYALARAARDAGAQVTLVSGPTSLAAPRGVDLVGVTSAAQMLEATVAAFAGADAAVLAAAVADYTPASPADHKLKKAHEHLSSVELVETADILATLSADSGDRVVVGFAAETNDLIANATSKLARKGCDMIVANDVSRPESTFGSDTNRVTLVTAEGTEPLELMGKDDVAHAIVGRVARLIAQKRSGRA